MSSLRRKKILITGSTGFIGSNLVRRSVKFGSDVFILTRKLSDTWRIKSILDDVTRYEVDLTDYEHLEAMIKGIQPDIIYHTAAYGGNPFQKDFKKIIESNYIGTANLVNACKGADFELFVNTGSSSEYGIKASTMGEEDRLEPVNDYGVSKASASLYCQFVARTERKPIITLRLFSPYGSYEESTRLIPSVILDCIKGKNPKVTSLSFVRDFVFIDDVVDAYFNAVDASEIGGEIINIGSGIQHSVGDVANKIIELTGNEVVPETGGRPRWANEPERWQADISKAKRLLNWEPKHDLAQGLAASVEWFKEHIDLYQELP